MFKVQLLTLTCFATLIVLSHSEETKYFPNCGPSELFYINSTKTCSVEVFGTELDLTKLGNFTENGDVETRVALLNCFEKHLHVDFTGIIKAEDVPRLMAVSNIPNEEIRMFVQAEVEKCIAEHEGEAASVMKCIHENTEKVCM